MITNPQSGTAIDEVADGIYRIHTPVDLPAVPGGFSFNQYLIVDDEPMLFHTGLRHLFPLTKEAISKVMPVEKLRHIGFSHFEADECGALNEFLAVAPQAAPVSSEVGAMVSVNDVADRPGLGLADGAELNLGKHKLEFLYTPHVPHGWDCGIFFDKTTETLLCGDLFTQPGKGGPAVTGEDLVELSEMFRGPMDYYAHCPGTTPVFDRLAALNPKVLACMHGSAFQGNGSELLFRLRDAVTASAVKASA